MFKTVKTAGKEFNFHGSVNRNNYYNIHIQRDAVLHSFIISGNCSTCFGWYLHLKHVEQFPDKINCVKLHLVGYVY